MSVDAESLRRAALARAWSLPEGYAVVHHDGRAYGMSVKRFNGGRSLKLYAESLDGGDLVSANLYRGADGDHFRPCEMSEAKVLRFLAGLHHPNRPIRSA